MAMTESSIEALRAVRPADLLCAEPLDLKIREGIGLYGPPTDSEIHQIVSRLSQSFDNAVHDISREYCPVLAYCLDWQEQDDATILLESTLRDTADQRTDIQQCSLGYEPTSELWAGRDAKRLYRIHRYAGPLVLEGSREEQPIIVVENALMYGFQSRRADDVV